ncbi:MAG: hypothetical protein KDC18_09275, partial [Alphaproteobacteria bacterium]|nr:hypothetical protein [Alphaproteobacteria bacterium]
SGSPGLLDARGPLARFQDPQGLARAGDHLWVADTGNHALRRIDRATGAVATLAGAGRRGCALRTPAKGADTALASPWDVILAHGRLLFANAGTHQIGQMCLTSGYVEPLAGNAREGLCDGPALDAVLAQPSGLALSADGMALYVADSETSAIRRVGLGADARVDTLVGKGLFDFGHVNGPLCAARLQHATGLAFCDGAVLVADSYNHRLRSLDLAAGRMTDLDLPGGVALHEPSGLVADGPHRLLVSDTNNHRILEIDRAAGTVHTWMGGPSGSVGESVEESGAKTPCR